jgi:hypothetical protein
MWAKPPVRWEDQVTADGRKAAREGRHSKVDLRGGIFATASRGPNAEVEYRTPVVGCKQRTDAHSGARRTTDQTVDGRTVDGEAAR